MTIHALFRVCLDDRVSRSLPPGIGIIIIIVEPRTCTLPEPVAQRHIIFAAHAADQLLLASTTSRVSISYFCYQSKSIEMVLVGYIICLAFTLGHLLPSHRPLYCIPSDSDSELRLACVSNPGLTLVKLTFLTSTQRHNLPKVSRKEEYSYY